MVRQKATSPDALIDRFLNYLLVEKGLAQKTIEAYSRDIIRYRNFLAVNKSSAFSEEDTPLILKHLILLRKSGLKARSRARHLVAIRGFYRFLVQEKILQNDPARLIDLPKSGLKLPHVLSKEEIERLLNAPDTDKALGVRDAAMLELLYAAGLRVSELINLKLQDINLEAGFVRIFGKGSRERIVPIGAHAREKVSTYLKTVRPKRLKQATSPYLFIARAAKPMTRQGFWKLLRRYAIKVPAIILKNCIKNIIPGDRSPGIDKNHCRHYPSIRLSTFAGIAQKSTRSMDETKILQGGQNFLGLPLPDQSIFMR
ncbi:MAG: tyrosine-type recombinase/integrase [Desulfobacterales bacterium]